MTLVGKICVPISNAFNVSPLIEWSIVLQRSLCCSYRYLSFGFCEWVDPCEVYGAFSTVFRDRLRLRFFLYSGTVPYRLYLFVFFVLSSAL